MTTHGPVIRIEDATVRYGATVALDGADFGLRRGEVHALIGENGAGKSTLLRLVMRVLAPDGGTVHVAAETRVAWAPQEASLPPDLTASEWIFLARERHRFGLLRATDMRRESTRVLRDLGCPVDPATRLGDLTAVQRKQVQLARALLDSPDVILLDEPTAALGVAEAVSLFELLRARRSSGCGVLYVTHRLDEVRSLADRVTVLRDGRRISTDPVSEVDTATLVRRMVGRDLQPHTGAPGETGRPVLRVSDLCVAQVRNVTLEVRRGEIVGLAGLVGAGRSEVLEAVAGLRRHRGDIWVDAPPLLVPEDRSAKGLVPTLCVRENIFLPAPQWRLDRADESRQTTTWIERLGIRTWGAEAPVGSLSGGNQQKLLLARALRRGSGLLLLDEPTAGVDVGAKMEIHSLVRRLAEGGAGILLASSDLTELLALSDRIVALYGGAIAGTLTAAEATEERVGGLITGAMDVTARA